VASNAEDALVAARNVAERARALRQVGADVALETAQVLEHRVTVLEAMGAPEDRIRAVRELAESERRVAAEWSEIARGDS
jgi:2-succinyl-5-enolpyruvyl-6-hydroxy-3-cyclohexene-1-carboxylate synthase